MNYSKIPKTSPSMYNPHKYKPPRLVMGGLYLEIVLECKKKIKKRYSNTYFYLPKNYYLCRIIAVKKCHSLLLFT